MLGGAILPICVHTSSFETKKLSISRQFRHFHLYKSQNLEIKIYGLNQKTPLRFFEKWGLQYIYLLGISSKIGGKWGHLVFFGPLV